MNEAEAIQRVWDYQLLHHELLPADVIMVLGSHDPRVAEWGADLYLRGLAPCLLMSGGLGNFTEGVWTEPEAEVFARIARDRGVPSDAIRVEPASSNTGENIQFSDRLLADQGVCAKRMILVQKPYMERRTYATARVYWPKRELYISSPPLSLEQYPNEDISRTDLVNIMVGDLQRIRLYPAHGFQITQEIPDAVWAAWECLVAAGYDRHLLE